MSSKDDYGQAGETETELRFQLGEISKIENPTAKRSALSTLFGRMYSLIKSKEEEDYQSKVKKGEIKDDDPTFSQPPSHTPDADNFMRRMLETVSNISDFDETAVARKMGWIIRDTRYNIAVPVNEDNYKDGTSYFESRQDKSINEALNLLVVGEMNAWLEMHGVFDYRRKSNPDRLKMLNDQVRKGDSEDDGDDDL